MPDRIRCGVIGAGWWATFAHIPALLTHPGADLVAIQTRDRMDAKRIAQDFGVPNACTTVEELLAIEGMQAVVVSSSPNLHYEQTLAALRRGMHVLIEKPMTLTTAEAMELQEMASSRGLQLLISCPWHYTAHAREAQKLIQEGKLGEIRMINMLMTNPVSHLLRGVGTEPTYGTPYLHPNRDTYSDPKIAGGGQIYAQVCHVAAYLTFLTGATPLEVFARFHNDGEKLDIYDTLNLRMLDESIVSIASTGATSNDRRDFEVRVFGTHGMLFIDLWRGKLEFVRMSGGSRVYAELAADEVYPHRAPALNLIDSIVDPSQNQSPARLGVAAMQVVEAACLSAKNQQNILISGLVQQSV